MLLVACNLVRLLEHLIVCHRPSLVKQITRSTGDECEEACTRQLMHIDLAVHFINSHIYSTSYVYDPIFFTQFRPL